MLPNEVFLKHPLEPNDSSSRLQLDDDIYITAQSLDIYDEDNATDTANKGKTIRIKLCLCLKSEHNYLDDALIADMFMYDYIIDCGDALLIEKNRCHQEIIINSALDDMKQKIDNKIKKSKESES